MIGLELAGLVDLLQAFLSVITSPNGLQLASDIGPGAFELVAQHVDQGEWINDSQTIIDHHAC